MVADRRRLVPRRVQVGLVFRFCLLSSLFPLLFFLLSRYSSSAVVHKSLVPLTTPCSSGKEKITRLSSSDAILSIDLLNNWHWCPSALARMRQLDEPVNEFLKEARSVGALVIHAVSDSKPHYLDEPGVAAAAVKRAELHVPIAATNWDAVNKFMLREYHPPVYSTLSLDRACGESKRKWFGRKKPAEMRGLNESNVNVLTDKIAIDQNVIYSLLQTHRPRVRRIWFVGVHLDLCVLYSRWFSLLRMAKFWDLSSVEEYSLVTSLLDLSTYGNDTTTTRNSQAVEEFSSWVACEAFPKFMGTERSAAVVRVYSYQ